MILLCMHKGSIIRTFQNITISLCYLIIRFGRKKKISVFKLPHTYKENSTARLWLGLRGRAPIILRKFNLTLIFEHYFNGLPSQNVLILVVSSILLVEIKPNPRIIFIFTCLFILFLFHQCTHISTYWTLISLH